MTSFFDSNTLLYLVSSDDRKAASATDLVSSGGAISVQVLNEVVNVARRKLQLGWRAIDELIMALRAEPAVHAVTIETHALGRRIAERHQLATFDAMIVAAALLAGCDTLWSEDMHHGLVVERRLTVRNPFA